MSEAELHLIRSRLTAGLRHKAARRELRQFLPVGLDYDETGAVVISADEAVVEAIATVFRRPRVGDPPRTESCSASPTSGA